MSESSPEIAPVPPPEKSDSPSETLPGQASEEELDPTAEAEEDAPTEDEAARDDFSDEPPTDPESEAPPEDDPVDQQRDDAPPDASELEAPPERGPDAEPQPEHSEPAASVEPEPATDPGEADRQERIEAARADVAAAIEQQERIDAARDAVAEAFEQAEVADSVRVTDPAQGVQDGTGDAVALRVDDSSSDSPPPDDRVPTGDPRLEEVWNESTETAAGRAFHEQGDLLPLAEVVTPMEGYYTADLHGNADGMVAPSADGLVDISAADLADLIRSDPNWDGQPVRLLSCDTGLAPSDGSESVAQRLADDLKVSVIAPEGVGESDWQGNVYSGGTDAFGAPKPVDSAGWPAFYPRTY